MVAVVLPEPVMVDLVNATVMPLVVVLVSATSPLNPLLPATATVLEAEPPALTVPDAGDSDSAKSGVGAAVTRSVSWAECVLSPDAPAMVTTLEPATALDEAVKVSCALPAPWICEGLK